MAVDDGSFAQLRRHAVGPLHELNLGKHWRQFRFFVRLFTYTELRDWLLTAGFTRVDGHGDRGGPLTLDSQRLIVTAQC